MDETQLARTTTSSGTCCGGCNGGYCALDYVGFVAVLLLELRTCIESIGLHCVASVPTIIVIAHLEEATSGGLKPLRRQLILSFTGHLNR